MGLQGPSDLFDQFKNVSESDYNTLVKSFSNKASQKEVKSAVDSLSQKVLFRPSPDGVVAETMYSKIGKFFRNLFSFTSRSEATEFAKARDTMQAKIEKETERIGNAILQTGNLAQEDAERLQKNKFTAQVMNSVVEKINRRTAEEKRPMAKLQPLNSLENPVEIAISALEKKIQNFKKDYVHRVAAQKLIEKMTEDIKAIRNLNRNAAQFQKLQEISQQIPELPPKVVEKPSSHHVKWVPPRKKKLNQ
jgi:hypothetical protein